ncbi:MAG: response regulator, partial [Alphaproteobacteria bacterium]
DVTVAQDGAAALAATVRKHFDAILMDMHMPKMDGFEATRRIRALGGEYAQLPILAVTANALDGDRERCLDAGATDYFQKPINFERLCSRLAELAAAKQAHNRAAG